MIRALSVTPRHIFVAALFVLGGLILAWAVRAYEVQSQVQVSPPAVEVEGAAELALREMDALFALQKPAPERYDVIAERNLFSPERIAWAPPPPPETPPVAAAEPEVPPPPPPGRRNVRLYGTQMTPEGRAALLYFAEFSSSNKHRLVREGEIARDDNDRQQYRLVRVTRESATLADSQDREFDVGLYDHERIATAQPPAQAAQPSVQIRGRAAPAQQPAEEPAAAEDGAQEPTQAAQEETPPQPPAQATPPQLVPFGQEPNEDMERLVQEGKMRKINTPFGIIYRPVQ